MLWELTHTLLTVDSRLLILNHNKFLSIQLLGETSTLFAARFQFMSSTTHEPVDHLYLE